MASLEDEDYSLANIWKCSLVWYGHRPEKGQDNRIDTSKKIVQKMLYQYLYNYFTVNKIRQLGSSHMKQSMIDNEQNLATLSLIPTFWSGGWDTHPWSNLDIVLYIGEIYKA